MSVLHLDRLRPFAFSASVVIGVVSACYSGPTLDQGYYGAVGSPDGGGSSTCTPDIASIQRTVFGPSCTQSGCHNAVERAAGLNLAASNVEAQLVGQASTCPESILVVPGAPEKSYLLQKLEGAKPSCGDPMPLGGSTLPSASRDCVRAWIASLTPGSVDAGVDAAGCGDTQTSPMNCGKCGNACASNAACVAGKCTCPGGASTVCGTTCVDTESDAKNCGKCGNVCPPSEKYCSAGACSAACSPASLTACPDGSCVDLSTSFTNCGACGKSCLSGQVCTGGTCGCPNNGIFCNGTCVANNTTTNCGTCGNACAPGQSCTNGACSCGTASVSFSGTIQPIFTASCATAGCHTKGASGQLPTSVLGLNLASGAAYTNLVNVDAAQCTDTRVRVKPTEPGSSYLMDKLLGVNLCGTGTQMPKKGTSLAPADIAAIGNWICAGAPNN